MKTVKKIIMIGLGLALFATACKKNDFTSGPELKSNDLASIPGYLPLDGAWVLTGQEANWMGNYYPFSSGALPTSITFPGSSSGTPTKSYYAVGGRSLAGYFWTLGQVSDPSLTTFGQRGISRFSPTASAIGSLNFKSIGPTRIPMTLQKSEINFHIHNGASAYYTDVEFEPGKIYRFNPMSYNLNPNKIWDLTTDLNSNKTLENDGYKNATYKHLGGKLLIRRGNTIYADVTFGNSYNDLNQVVQSTNSIYIAAINASTGGLITVSSVAGATNIGLFNDHPLVNEDPISNHIYFSAVGNMEAIIAPAKIFRIKNNSDEIDPTFVRDYQSFGQIGQFNTLYAYNDYLYIKYSTTNVEYSHAPSSNYRTNVWQWAVINPEGTKKNLNIPIDNFYAYQQPRLINGEIYFIYNNSTATGIHKVAPLDAISWAAATPIATTSVGTLNATSKSIVRISGIDKALY